MQTSSNASRHPPEPPHRETTEFASNQPPRILARHVPAARAWEDFRRLARRGIRLAEPTPTPPGMAHAGAELVGILHNPEAPAHVDPQP